MEGARGIGVDVWGGDLYEATDGLAVGGHDVLVVGVHDLVALGPGVQVLGHVQVDLVPVKVGVEGGAVGVVHADGPLALHRFISSRGGGFIGLM